MVISPTKYGDLTDMSPRNGGVFCGELMWVKQCHEPMTGNGFNIPPMVMTGELFLYGGFTMS